MQREAIWRARRASMGPHSFERGNLSLRPACDAQPKRFNGASLFRARKREEMVQADREPWASMGPHSFERGNLLHEGDGIPHEVGLQWGLTLSSEETTPIAPQSTGGAPLQWGLTLSSEETGVASLCNCSMPCASMGPHSFERGNLQMLPLRQHHRSRFNGASLFRARKRAIWGWCHQRLPCFNGASLFRARKPGR